MKRIYHILLFLLLVSGAYPQSVINLSDSAIHAWTHRVQKELDSLISHDPLLERSQLGLLVYDLTADSIFYAHQHQQTMRPASTMKLVTAITALEFLGGDYQLKTTLSYTGEIVNRTLTGSLFCVGGMDPMFDGQNMREFANSVKALGIDTLRGSIVTDRSMKEGEEWGEGWCWDDENPKLSPLLIDRKDNFADRLISELLEVGVVIDSLTLFDDNKTLDAIPLCTCTHTMDELLLRMMKDSDNLYAECLYYQMGATLYHRPAQAIQSRSLEGQLIRQLGLNSDNYRLADGSGLSLYNYISTELLVTLLRHAWATPGVYVHLLPSLPIAGGDGTLKRRMLRTPAQYNVRAKTGTLTGIISLAGYLTAGNGHQFCFAMINQSVLNKKEARAFQDRLCTILCRQDGQTETKKAQPVYKKQAKAFQRKKSRKQRRGKRR